MASNAKSFCFSCSIKKTLKLPSSYYLDEHIPNNFRQPIIKCIPQLKEQNIKLKDFIKSGYFGCVCTAKMNGQEVAVKAVLDKNLPNFETEFSIVKDFDHINVMSFSFQIKLEGIKFLVMPLAKYDLRTFLKQFVNKQKRLLTENEIRIIFRMIVFGVEYIHQKGFAHKDIKLRNILMMDNLIPKISDFDLIEYCYRKDGKLKYKTVRMGTASYFAPESILKEPVSDLRKVDVWALGIVLFEMLFLRTPFGPVGTPLKEITKYQPYVDDNQLERNIPQNSVIGSETMNLLRRLLINDHWIRERLTVIIETELWFKDRRQLSTENRPIPVYTRYSVFCLNEVNPNQSKISKIVSFLRN